MRATVEQLEARWLLAADLAVDIVASESSQYEVLIANHGDENADNIELEVSTSLESSGWSRTSDSQRRILVDPVPWPGDVDLPFTSNIFAVPGVTPTHPSAVGDINGDGVVDFGTSVFNVESRDNYFVRVFFGGPEVTGSTSNWFDLRLTGEMNFDVRVGRAGDFNDDGVDDLVIVSRERSGELDSLIYVVYGRTDFAAGQVFDLSTLDGTNGFVTGRERGLLESATAGDFNGDGIDDLVVSTGFFDTSSGTLRTFTEAYVLFGGADAVTDGEFDLFDLAPDAGLILEVPNSIATGFMIGSGGDTNGDGLDDILFGSGIDDSDHFVVYGGQDGVVRIGFEEGYGLISSDESFSFGNNRQVANAGDFNGDGLNDLLLTVTERGDPFTSVYLVLGSSEPRDVFDITDTANASQVIRINGIIPEQALGEIALSGAGDVNGDSYDDIVIGSPEENFQAGAVYVIYGGPDVPNEIDPLTDLHGDLGFEVIANRFIIDVFGGIGELFGSHVAGLGDINDDGLDDLGVGTRGTSYIVYGHTNDGEGDVSDIIPRLGPGESVTYQITGQPSAGGFNLVATAAFADSNPANNRASLTQAELVGDVNLDVETSFADFLALSQNFGQTVKSRLDCDLNDDALVSFEDFLILANDFGNRIDALAG